MHSPDVDQETLNSHVVPGDYIGTADGPSRKKSDATKRDRGRRQDTGVHLPAGWALETAEEVSARTPAFSGAFRPIGARPYSAAKGTRRSVEKRRRALVRGHPHSPEQGRVYKQR